MTNDQRHIIDTFEAGVSLVKTGPDSFPLSGRGLELETLARLALKVRVILTRRDDLDAEERSLLNLADATSRLIAATPSGDRDPAIREAWFRARAELSSRGTDHTQQARRFA